MKRGRVKCISVGYQGRDVDQMVSALASAGATVLLDVREAAWSQRPEFRKTALASALARKRIRYVHEKTAGNPFRPRDGKRLSWSVCARRYRAHLAANPGVVDRVFAVLAASTVAVLCYEQSASECHRGILLAEVERRHGPLEIVELGGAA